MQAWESELRGIAEKHGGVLKAEDVVSFAAKPDTALHSKFTWEDTEAARLWRLLEARNLIAVAVIVSPSTGKSYRAFVSMVDDRQEEGGGYRSLVSVLSNSQLRGRLLEQALADFERWKEKYQDLRELAPIFAARKNVRAELVAEESRAAAG